MEVQFKQKQLWLARLVLALTILVIYGWTAFEPLTGDALMHAMDDTNIRSFRDIVRIFISNDPNPIYPEYHRLLGFHRPVFNEVYMSALKGIFGLNPLDFRLVTLILMTLTSWIFLEIMIKLKKSILSSLLGSFWLILSPPLFFGLYEFGLSFSQLLLFFSFLAIYFLVLTVQSKNSFIYSILTFIFTFLAVFTKESLIFFPLMLLALYFVIVDMQEIDNSDPIEKRVFLKRSLGKHSFLLFALILISFSYLITRYHKLGSLTAIAGGIEQAPTLVDSFVKLLGYFLLDFQLPTSIIPRYMIIPFLELNHLELAVRLLCVCGGFVFFINAYRRNRYVTILLLIATVFAFLPIIKVSRNAPYYGDLMLIPISVLIAIGANVTEMTSPRIFRQLFAIVIMALCFSAVKLSSTYVSNTGLWLTRAQGFGRAALSDISAALDVEGLTKVVGLSGMVSQEASWTLSHNRSIFGAIFTANLNVDRNAIVLGTDNALNNRGVLLIDFVTDSNSRKLPGYLTPGYGKLVSAYYADGIDKRKISPLEGNYKVSEYKALRIECSGGDKPDLTFSVKLKNGSSMLKTYTSDMNLTVENVGKSVYELILPSNSMEIKNITPKACQELYIFGLTDSEV